MRGLACLIACAVLPTFGNDGSASSTPTGGIQLTREPRISMEKERLTIGLERVTVEYEFLNESNQDIATEVAFPVPPYGLNPAYDPVMLEDFQIWVDGRVTGYQTAVKAMIG